MLRLLSAQESRAPLHTEGLLSAVFITERFYQNNVIVQSLFQIFLYFHFTITIYWLLKIKKYSCSLK